MGVIEHAATSGPALAVTGLTMVIVITDVADGQVSAILNPVSVRLAEPAKISKGPGVYTGCNMFGSLKFPSPAVVQRTRTQLEVSEVESVTLLSAQIVALFPAKTLGLLITFTSPSTSFPSQPSMVLSITVKV
jgi:hypothetical protein